MQERRISKKPSSQEEMILKLARLASDLARWQEIPVQEWPEIVRLARLHGLAPLLWWRLQQQGRQISDLAAFEKLEDAAKVANFSYQIMLENQSLVQLALTRAGIPAIWIKGIALAQTLYPLPQLRPMDDLDLLVPYDRRQAALQVIQSIGYDFLPENALAKKIHAPESFPYHYHLLGGTSGEIDLEIHYLLLGENKLLPVMEMDWFWQERATIGQGQATFSVLKPEAHFLYLCAHAILHHGESEFHLQRYYDLHLLASQTRIKWDLVVARAKELGWNYTIARALALTNYYFATSIPQRAINDLNSYQLSDTDYLHARRLQGPDQRWERTWLSLSEFPWGERIRQLFHMTFPPAEYMRAWYAIPKGQAILPYYLFRWLDAARAIFTAILRRFRSRP